MANKTPDFSQVLELLRDTSQPYPAASLYQLSGLSRDELAALQAAWDELPEDRRAEIIQGLHDISEVDFEVSFDEVFQLAMEDEAPVVRATAIRAMWDTEDERLVDPLVEFMQNDPDHQVRAAAASALGRFVYLAEIEEIDDAVGSRLIDTLLEVVKGDDDIEVRRRALEAVGYSSRPDVLPLITDAYSESESLWRISAVFAMGRNADAALWGDTVRAELKSRDPEMRFEAARAAGELELEAAAPELAMLTLDEDDQVQTAAIWSLSQIGGDIARNTLTHLADSTEDEDEAEQLEEALANLAFTDEMQAFTMMHLDGASEDGLGTDDDLLASLSVFRRPCHFEYNGRATGRP